MIKNIVKFILLHIKQCTMGKKSYAWELFYYYFILFLLLLFLLIDLLIKAIPGTVKYFFIFLVLCRVFFRFIPKS